MSKSAGKTKSADVIAMSGGASDAAKAGAASDEAAVEEAADGQTKEPPTPRGRGRPRHGKAVARNLPRDEEILRIAAEVLYKKGFDGARLDDIAQAAGIVKGSLYHYFGSKEEIYERLVNNVRGRINFEEEITGKAPARERLEHLVRTRLQTTVEYPLEVGLLAREITRMEGPVGEWAREDPKRYFVAIRQIIIQGQKEGAFRPADPDILASTILGIFAYLPTWFRRGGRIRPDALVDEITEYILRGVLETQG